MPHEIATTDGRPAIAYFGKTPWHGLGTKLEEPATAADAIQAAGLDYEVALIPLLTLDLFQVPQRKAIVRHDVGKVLGVVGNSYVPIQNREAFAFMDAVAAEGGVRYHTAGALGQGERIWLLAKLPGHIRVKDSDDITEKYLLLSNAHDGTASLRVYWTPVRVVCANTLAIANRRNSGQGISILHKGDLAAKVQEAQKVLGLAVKFYDDLEGQIEHLASFFPTAEQVAAYFRTLYPDPADSDTTRAENTRETLLRLFDRGMGQDIPAIRHSAWAALHAVTEYVDHHRPSRGKNDSERANRRLASLWFGSGARVKQLAWDQALAMAGGN